ncbi:MAG: radical SAM protein [PVC group bacterium]|nr:radical SAM protein [PVC group bacterium]
MKDKMKIILFRPNYDVHVVFPPMALGYLAASLIKEGHQVDIYDGTLKNSSTQDFLKEIEETAPDLIGITVMSRGHAKVRDVVKLIKNTCDIPIVIGGPQVTALPEIVLKDIGADFAVFGEGEITICELAQAMVSGKQSYDSINGLAYVAKDGTIIVNNPRELIKDLDQISFPAWQLMNPADYRIVPILAPAKGYPIAPIVTSRGCPFLCTFCASNVTWKNKFRVRSPENVVDEIKLLVEKFGVREIYITDDNLTLNRKHAEAICDEIMKAGLKISWQCPNGVRIDHLDQKLLAKMKKAGCYSVGLGIESANKEILCNIKKQLDLSVVKKVLIDLKKAGIMSYGFFVFGLPGETHETIRETIDFAKNNPFDRAWFNILTPYPGSEIFNDWIGERSFADIDWETHDGSTAVIDTVELSSAELEEYQTKAVREFYLRPRIVLSLMRHIRIKQIITISMTRFFKKRYNIFKIIHQAAHFFVRKRVKQKTN